MPDTAEVSSHIQFPAAMVASLKVVVVAPERLVVVRDAENRLVGEPLFLVAAYLICQVTEGEVPRITSETSLIVMAFLV